MGHTTTVDFTQNFFAVDGVDENSIGEHLLPITEAGQDGRLIGVGAGREPQLRKSRRSMLQPRVAASRNMARA